MIRKTTTLEPEAPAVSPPGHHLAPLPQESTDPPQIRGVLRPTWRSSDAAPGALARVSEAVSHQVASEKDRGLGFLMLPVAMGLGAAMYFMAVRDPPLVLIVIGLLAGFAAAWMARASNPAMAQIAALAAAIFAGALAAAIEVSRGPVLMDSDVTTHISGQVMAREFDDRGRVRYLIRLTSTAEPEIRRPPPRVRLVARASHDPIPIGGGISGRARLSSPSGPVLPGGYDFAFRAFTDGIGAHGFFYQAPEAVAVQGGPATAGSSPWLGLRDVRERIAGRIRSVLSDDPGGIAAALAVSDRRGITEATVEALRATGLAHILAISGLHMALASGLLYVGLRLVMACFPALAEGWPVKKIAAVGALMTATAYLLISGGSVPTRRAWVMLSVMLIAVVFDRPALTMRNVALAALVIIIISPSAVVGPGFQMSFAATAALIAVYAAISRRMADPKRRFGPSALIAMFPGWLVFIVKAALGLAITSLVAGLATGLFSAHHFHRVAGYGLLANLLAMPLVTLVVMPAGLAAMLAMPLGLDQLPLQIMGLGLKGVIAVAYFVHGLGGDIQVGLVPFHATAISGAGFVTLVFLASRLRLAGLALIAIGMVSASPALAPPRPDIMVSEDGRLVGLYGPRNLASNATRPSDFVFSQWQTALGGTAHRAPDMHRSIKMPVDDPASQDLQMQDAPSPDLGALVLEPLLAKARQETSRFQCAARGICVAWHRGAVIVAINRPELIGPACDRADLLIVSIPVRMTSCRSGATLITARTLRRSGSLAIYVANNAGPEASTPQPAETAIALPREQDETTTVFARKRALLTSEAAYNAGKQVWPDFRIEAAVADVVRPWTVQRYYDWRTRSFDLPD
ncbi:ComEC/Rec2 family competence protein [Hoeflea sp.]|uniref:ComEC/Rec2 family competence protein n=1 Tax=Hoeflea sp. TaxID=1940281 RepID=UPI003B527D14